MATFAKENAPLIPIRTWTTGAQDTSSHTVKLQPKNYAYPTNAIDCSQTTQELWLWRPDSDLDSDTDYWIYIDGTKKGHYNAINGISTVI